MEKVNANSVKRFEKACRNDVNKMKKFSKYFLPNIVNNEKQNVTHNFIRCSYLKTIFHGICNVKRLSFIFVVLPTF